ncbi:MAG TPA: YciI family protein [Gemmatimonadales bacterium]|nr:YciI family protein [Gemmatimonadales bacterium]
MKFLAIFRTKETGNPPTPEMMARMGKLIEDEMRTGVLLATEGCLPSSLGARVRQANGAISVTDGPFTESKELVGGFAILRVASKVEAIEATRRFLAVAGDGETELRQIYEPPGDAR